MGRIKHLIQKEFRQIFRDRPMVAIIFMVPVIQMLVLSYAITTDVKHIKLAVRDYDNSVVSREIVRAFSQTERFDIVPTAPGKPIREQMKGWEIQMALVVPQNFQKEFGRHLSPQIQLIVDGVDGNTAGVALGYASGILERLDIQPTVSAPPPPAGVVQMAERMWYNLELDSKQYMVPGIVVVLLTIIPMMLSAMSLVKEKEIGTLEQLMVTPLRKHQLLLGKIIPFLLLSYLELAMVIIFAMVVFGISMNGSYGLLGFLAFLYLFTTIGLGIFISTFTQSQQQAMFVSWFAMVFMILMSGFFIPIENMPAVLQKITYLNPMRYIMYIVRDIFQKGSGLRYLLGDAVPMTAFGLLIFTFGVLKFRKRVS